MSNAQQQETAGRDQMVRQLHLLGIWLVEQGKIRPVCTDDYSHLALDYVMTEHGLGGRKGRE